MIINMYKISTHRTGSCYLISVLITCIHSFFFLFTVGSRYMVFWMPTSGVIDFAGALCGVARV